MEVDKSEKPKKVKKVKDPEKAKKVRKISVELFFLSVIIFFAVFTDRIPYFQDSEFAHIIENTLGKFFDISTIFVDNYLKILETLTIIVFVWALIKLSNVILKLLSRKKRRNSANYILLKSVIKYTIVFFGIIFIMSAWGVDTTTILASVGLLGLAISFGAQGLMEDLISGLFLIFERQFEVGDIVKIGDFRGVVHEMGIRTTKFMDQYTLDVKIMKNSDVKDVINASIKLSVAVCDIGISYDEKLEKVENIINEALPDIAQRHRGAIYNEPVYLGVQSLADSSVVLRIVAKTTEKKKAEVERTLNRELKLLFDSKKISVPYPQLDIHTDKK